MACGAIPESLSCLDCHSPVARQASETRESSSRISEKQYHQPFGLSRDCRFFLISVPAFDRALSTPIENAGRTVQPNPT
jgi:hypothetical protein